MDEKIMVEEAIDGLGIDLDSLPPGDQGNLVGALVGALQNDPALHTTFITKDTGTTSFWTPEATGRIGYVIRAYKELEIARSVALQGQGEAMEHHLTQAVEFAGMSDFSIDHLIAEIEPLGYKSAVRYEMKRALEAAREGDIEDMETALGFARGFDQSYESLIHKGKSEQGSSGTFYSDKKSSVIRRYGYQLAILDELETASKAAHKGDIHDMENALEHAQAYANRIGQTVDHGIISGIRGIGYPHEIERLVQRAQFRNARLLPFSNEIITAAIYANRIGTTITSVLNAADAKSHSLN